MSIRLRRSTGGLLLAIVTLQACYMEAPAVAATGGARCRHAAVPKYSPMAGKRTTLTPIDDYTKSPPVINFGTSRGVRNNLPSYRYRLTGPHVKPKTLSWDVQLIDSNNNSIPQKNFGVHFSYSVDEFVVSLCISGRDVSAGSYSGQLTFAGGSLRPTTVPVTVNFKDNSTFLIWSVLVVVSILAVFYKWWMVRIADPTTGNDPSLTQFFGWAKRKWITILIAIFGAGIAVIYPKYIKAKSFTPDDRWILWGAMFAAVTSAALLLTAIGGAEQNQPPNTDPPETPAETPAGEPGAAGAGPAGA